MAAKRKQPHLPKTQTDVERRIDELAGTICELNAKIEAAEAEKAQPWQELEKLMSANNVDTYRYRDGDIDKVFTFKTVGQLKVRNPKKSEKAEG